MTSEDSSALLQWARDEFPAFYAAATARDGAIFDALVLTRTEYAAGIAAPREGLPFEARRVLEHHTDAREREFVGLCDSVLHSDTFRAQDADERARIAQMLLAPPDVFE